MTPEVAHIWVEGLCRLACIAASGFVLYRIAKGIFG